jgi:hypothetical protein
MFVAVFGYCGLDGRAAGNPAQVSTYHGDTLRTGWNANETLLTPASVLSGAFKERSVVDVDAQVDAQPLYVGSQAINGQGSHNVVYVVTENNTVYAIDGDSGTVLLQRNFGTPVPIAALPGQCSDNSAFVGITSTPVLNVAAQTMYVITYTFENSKPVYRLHALDLRSLGDVIAPVVISGSGTLTPTNAPYRFNPAVARSRAALLLANGNVYAAFSSFCDFSANIARGWVLGWNASNLAPLSHPELLNREATSTNQYFLGGVWMSGYGIAANAAGSLYFITGNSDPAGTNYHPPFAIGESVVKLSPDLTTVQSYFTPAGTGGVDYKSLDAADKDFSAGGVMLLPPQPGANPNIAVAAGKIGVMYLLNPNDLGGYLQGIPPYRDRIFNSYVIGPCNCGQSYFTGSDGVGRVVSSGANQATVWKVGVTPIPNLTQESISAPIVDGANKGFFTTISSNGIAAKSQIIWAVGRPINTSPAIVTLYAFDPSTINASGNMKTLFSGPAGNWPMHGMANLVPTVANGHVYVGSYQQLTIFAVPGGASGGGGGGGGGGTGPDQVAFTASASLAAGVGPHVNVVVDGKTLGSANVGAASATYSFNTTLARNTGHDIQIQYTNDNTINGHDRNLYLASITVDNQVIPSSSKYEVYRAPGHGTFPSSGSMLWDGVADFNLPSTLFGGNPVSHHCGKDKDDDDDQGDEGDQGDDGDQGDQGGDHHHHHHPCKKHNDREPDAADAAVPGHAVYGIITASHKGSLTIRTREGKLVKIDSTVATKTFHTAVPTVGTAVLVRGDYDGKGKLHARSVQRTQDRPSLWGKDR